MTNKTKEINGKTFSVAPFMAIEGLRLKAYLVKTFGGAFAELFSDVKSLESEVNGKGISRAIEKLTETLSEDDFIALLNRLFKNVVVSWKDEEGAHTLAFATDFNTTMDVVFKEHLFDIYPLAQFVLEVNYPDFFTKILPSFGFQMRTTLG